MTELGGGDVPKTTLPRRGFLKLIPALLGGAVVGATIGKQEATKIKEGWFEHDGVRYFPLYESHPIGPTKELPKEADALFCEINVQQNEEGWTIYNIPASILGNLLSRYAGREIPGKKQLRDTATSRRIPVAVGDVRGNPVFNEEVSIPQIERALGIVNKEDRATFL